MGQVKLRMPKVWTISSLPFIHNKKPTPDFENIDFKVARGLRKILTVNFKKEVNTAEKQSTIREEITYKQTYCLDDLRLLQK